MSKVDLNGKIAIVTGASAGIGRNFAKTLAANGAAVILAARREAALEDLAGEISAKGGRAHAHAIDLADASAIPGLFDAAENAFGTVDILINNAGIPDANYATKLSLETIDRVIAVDLRAPFLLSVEAARRLMAAEMPGSIVNMASVAAYHYTSSSAAALYATIKSAMIRMTETLAIEWASYRINVNAIAPGLFESEMTAGFVERVGAKALQRFPRGRFGDPAYLDSTLLYLVDPDSHFVTGSCVVVDDAQTGR